MEKLKDTDVNYYIKDSSTLFPKIYDSFKEAQTDAIELCKKNKKSLFILKTVAIATPFETVTVEIRGEQ